MVREGRAGGAGPAEPYGWAVLGASLLLWFAVWNGFPVVYEDSVAYLQRPARALAGLGLDSGWAAQPDGPVRPTVAVPRPDKAWMAGRSVYFGVPNAIIASLFGSFVVVALQAYLTAAVLALAWFRTGGRALGYVVAVALVAATTGAAVVVAALLPDYLTPLAIVAVALSAAYWDRLGTVDRAFLGGVAAFGAMSHDSILVLLAALFVGGVATMFYGRRPGSRWRWLVIPGAAIVAGGLGTALFTALAIHVTGEPPKRLPHLSARVATSPVGRAVLTERCGSVDLEICRHQSQAGRGNWIDFLFSRDRETGVYAIADAATKKRLSGEQGRVLATVATRDPLGLARLVSEDIGAQLVTFSLTDLDPSGKKIFYATRLGGDLREQVEKTRSYRDEGRWMGLLSLLTWVSVASAMVILIVLIRTRSLVEEPVRQLVVWTVAGVFANAVICAALAGVYDRFQARVVWLLPFAAAILFAAWNRRRAESLQVRGIGGRDREYRGSEAPISPG